MVPLRLLGVYRFDVAANEWGIPLVPYVKAGLVGIPFWVIKGPDLERVNGEPGSGVRFGYQFTGGIALQLDFLDRRFARDFDSGGHQPQLPVRGVHPGERGQLRLGGAWCSPIAAGCSGWASSTDRDVVMSEASGARITVLLFAAARERAGTSRLELTVPAEGLSLEDLLERLFAQAPLLSPLRPYLRVAVDRDFAPAGSWVRAGAEVALIPPVSGGSGGGCFRVVDRALSLDEVVRAVEGPGPARWSPSPARCGTRPPGRPVLRLEYEAYAPMAEAVLSRLGAEVAGRWAGTRVAIAHRVGVLSPGELAVVIAAASPHRAEAFEACRYAIEQLKVEAPIWKKEVFTDGSVWVGLGP